MAFLQILMSRSISAGDPRAVAGVRAMHRMGLRVYICTSPLANYSSNVTEKFAWVEEHLGLEWTRRLIIAKDKTLVKGRYLIDDIPDVRGAIKPEWEHIIFDRVYNRNIPGPRKRMNWSDWQAILLGASS
jgi:5'-nucleotidase